MQNAPAHTPPHDGFVVEVGGEFVSEFNSLTAALRAGLELKHRDSAAQVKVYDAKDRPLERAAS